MLTFTIVSTVAKLKYRTRKNKSWGGWRAQEANFGLKPHYKISRKVVVAMPTSTVVAMETAIFFLLPTHTPSDA